MSPEVATDSCCTLQPIGNATRNIYHQQRNTSCNSRATGSLKVLANMVLDRNTAHNGSATDEVLSYQTLQHFDHEAFDERAAIIEDNGIPREWANGFAALCVKHCPTSYSLDRWEQLVNDGGLFLDMWGQKAAALGWRVLDVFGVNPYAPERRYDGSGLVALLQGRQIVAITADTARIECGNGNYLTFYRKTMAEDAVALWHLK